MQRRRKPKTLKAKMRLAFKIVRYALAAASAYQKSIRRTIKWPASYASGAAYVTEHGAEIITPSASFDNKNQKQYK